MKHIITMVLLMGMVFFAVAQQDGQTIEDEITSKEQVSGGEYNGDPTDPKEKEQGLKLFIPNAFTPNGDGINDYYQITNSNFKSFEFMVFDRWGNQIYTTTNSNFRWDGKVNGKTVLSGIYVFVFNGTTVDNLNIRRSGSISLVR